MPIYKRMEYSCIVYKGRDADISTSELMTAFRNDIPPAIPSEVGTLKEVMFYVMSVILSFLFVYKLSQK